MCNLNLFSLETEVQLCESDFHLRNKNLFSTFKTMTPWPKFKVIQLELVEQFQLNDTANVKSILMVHVSGKFTASVENKLC